VSKSVTTKKGRNCTTRKRGEKQPEEKIGSIFHFGNPVPGLELCTEKKRRMRKAEGKFWGEEGEAGARRKANPRRTIRAPMVKQARGGEKVLE